MADEDDYEEDYDEDYDLDSRDGTVKTKVNGPLGPTWIVLHRTSRLSDLQAVYHHKMDDYLERSGKDTATVFDLMNDPVHGHDAFKLYLWMSDRQTVIARLNSEEKEAKRIEEDGAFGESIERKKQILGRLLNEENQGKRLTVYSETAIITSLTKDSPHAELELILQAFYNRINPDEVKTIEKWMSKAKDKSLQELKDEPIRLRTLDGDGFNILTKDEHPDILRAAVRDRNVEIGSGKMAVIDSWIKDGDKKLPDHDYRIRIFHKGLDHGGDTTELDLSKYSINYVEKLQEHLTDIYGASLLPEHKARLDKRYDELLKQREDPQFKEPETLQVPVGIKGKAMIVSRITPSHVLETVHECYAFNLTEENRKLLWQWHMDAPREPQERNTILAYEQFDFTKFKTLHKFKDFEEIEKSLKSKDVYIRWHEAEKARDWVEGLEPIFPREPDQHVAALMHSTGLKLDMNLETVQKDPTKANELLSDPQWTTTERNRRLIESWLHRADRNPEEELVVSGQVYNRDQPVAELKQLADSMVENNFEQLTPAAAKKLLTWIHTKEKFGDDYYKDKPAPEPLQVPPHRYDVLLEEQRKLKIAMDDILSEVAQTKVPSKEKKKDKDEPFPSV